MDTPDKVNQKSCLLSPGAAVINEAHGKVTLAEQSLDLSFYQERNPQEMSSSGEDGIPEEVGTYISREETWEQITEGCYAVFSMFIEVWIRDNRFRIYWDTQWHIPVPVGSDSQGSESSSEAT